MMRLAAVFLLLAAALASPAAADDFYAGKTINLYIGSTPGGGYDSYARLLSRHWGDHIAGHPTIVPVNMAGAGSAKLATFLYAVAPKDGTAVGAVFPGAVLEPLIGSNPVTYEPSKFDYLGSVNTEAFICTMRSDSPVKSLKDAFTTEAKVAASAAGGSSRDFPLMLDSILGTKFKVVAGYPGSREMMLAEEQGEVNGLCGVGVSSFDEAVPDAIPTGKLIVIAQESLKHDPAMDALHAPMTLDFAKDDEQRQIMSLLYSQQIFGRPYIVPPGVPAQQLAILRAAFAETLRDPATLDDAKRVRLQVDPSSGEEVQALITKVFATPPNIVARLKQAIAKQP